MNTRRTLHLLTLTTAIWSLYSGLGIISGRDHFGEVPCQLINSVPHNVHWAGLTQGQYVVQFSTAYLT